LPTGFADQQVDVLRHDHIPHHQHLVLEARGFQSPQKEIAPSTTGEQRQPLIAAEGDEMQVAGAVVSFEVAGHGALVYKQAAVRRQESFLPRQAELV